MEILQECANWTEWFKIMVTEVSYTDLVHKRDKGYHQGGGKQKMNASGTRKGRPWNLDLKLGQEKERSPG